MIKVAMIGAGSVVFSKNLTGDILGFPEFKDATFSIWTSTPTGWKSGRTFAAKWDRRSAPARLSRRHRTGARR
jgi:hypothetical protein